MREASAPGQIWGSSGRKVALLRSIGTGDEVVIDIGEREIAEWRLIAVAEQENSVTFGPVKEGEPGLCLPLERIERVWKDARGWKIIARPTSGPVDVFLTRHHS